MTRERGSAELVAAAQAQQEATAGVERLLNTVTAQAQDPDGTVVALVGARGELRDLWLADDAVGWGPERLGAVIVQTAQAAARNAAQRAYDALAPVLGDTVTAAMAAMDVTPPRAGGAPTTARGGRTRR